MYLAHLYSPSVQTEPDRVAERMFLMMTMIVMVCGATANTLPTTPATPATPVNTTARTTNPTTPYRPLTRRPTMKSLIAEFIRKSEYHFKVIQNDQQGFFKVLKWNVDNAFTALEHELDKSITEVQKDMKVQNTAINSKITQLTDVQTALKNEMKSGLKRLENLVNVTITEVQKDMTVQNTALSAVDSKITQMKTQLTDVQSSQTALKTEMKSDLKRLENLVKASMHVADCSKQLNSVCYKIIKCNPACTHKKAKDMCKKMGATLAPIRSAAILTYVAAYHKAKLGDVWLHVDGRYDGTTWRYHDGSVMSYTHWSSGEPTNDNTQNHIELYTNTYMYDYGPGSGAGGVACAWE